MYFKLSNLSSTLTNKSSLSEITDTKYSGQELENINVDMSDNIKRFKQNTPATESKKGPSPPWRGL